MLETYGKGHTDSLRPARVFQNRVATVRLQTLHFRSPLGMLRRAIEEQWSEPAAATQQQSREAEQQRVGERDAQATAEQMAADQEKRRRLKEHSELLQRWQTLSTRERTLYHEQALMQASSEIVRRRLRRHKNLQTPPAETLQVMARDALAVAS